MFQRKEEQDVSWTFANVAKGSFEPCNADDSDTNAKSFQHSESYRDSMIHNEDRKSSFAEEPGARKQTFPSVIVRESALTHNDFSGAHRRYL